MKALKDTYLDLTDFGKGVAFFVNGVNIGRFWNVGPAFISLYSSWPSKGKEQTVSLFLRQKGNLKILFILLTNLHLKI